MRALEIYDTVKREYEGLHDKKRTLEKEREDVFKLIEVIEGRKNILFTDALKIVDKNFQKIFGQLSTKGDAYLKLENAEDPLSAGLQRLCHRS